MKQSQISAHQQAYDAVLNNPHWYGDQPGLLTKTFNAENTERRAEILIDILRRDAKRKTERQLSQRYLNLADKLFNCRRDRCGSSACLKCLRAFQQAKTIAHRRLIFQLAIKHPKWLWCIITIIPLELNYLRGTFHEFNAAEFNRHLKDTLTWGGLSRPFLGSIDFSLERSSVRKYWQPHWHLPLHTSDPKLLRENLKDLFPPMEKHDYPVDVAEAFDLNFLPYIHKGIRIKDLLRNGRTDLPELLLMLDQINPLEFLVTQGLALRAGEWGFKFEIGS
jgi:hypothetical protein